MVKEAEATEQEVYRDLKLRIAGIKLHGIIVQVASGKNFEKEEASRLVRKLINQEFVYYTRLDKVRRERWISQNAQTPYDISRNEANDQLRLFELERCAKDQIGGNYLSTKKHILERAYELAEIIYSQRDEGGTFISQLASKSSKRPFITFRKGLEQFSRELSLKGPAFTFCDVSGDVPIAQELAYTF